MEPSLATERPSPGGEEHTGSREERGALESSLSALKLGVPRTVLAGSRAGAAQEVSS